MTSFTRNRLKSVTVLGSILAFAVLSGCASKIDTQNEQQQVNEFVAQTIAAEQFIGDDELNWWQKLGSTQLNQLVSKSLANNYDLQTSQLLLKGALARLGEQQAQYLPQGGIELSAQRGGLGETNTRQSSANLALNWQLDLFGRITALVDAANASAMSQAEQVRLLQIEVVSSVAKGFVSYQGNLQKHFPVLKTI